MDFGLHIDACVVNMCALVCSQLEIWALSWDSGEGMSCVSVSGEDMGLGSCLYSVEAVYSNLCCGAGVDSVCD